MAFKREQLSGNMGVGSLAPTAFVYRDLGSTKAQIATADYFLEANQVLEVGDTIYAHGSNGGVNIHITASSAITVTVAENSLA